MKKTEVLVNEVLNGKTNSFEELYHRTSKQVYFTCLSFVKNEQDAQDLMQETYLSALTHLSSLKDPERFPQWVSRIVANKCKDHFAKKSPVLLEEEVLNNIPVSDDELTLPENYITDRAKRKILMNIMEEQLSMVQYQTVLLYYFDGLSQQEIAECMECPEGTVSYRLSVARDKIKEGILSYEKKSGDKLYCVAGVPFLAAFFISQADEIVVPDVLSSILSTFAPANTVAGKAVADTAVHQASETATQIAAGAAKETAAQSGVAAVTNSLFFKIGLGIAVLALITATIVSVILLPDILSKKTAAPVNIATGTDTGTTTGSENTLSRENAENSLSETESEEDSDVGTEYVYESENIAIEYVSSSYVEGDEGLNGRLQLVLNITNKTEQEIELDQMIYKVNGFTDSTSLWGNRKIAPGTREVIPELPLYEMKDNGPVEFSSTDLIFAFTNGFDTPYVEKSCFTLNLSEPIVFNALSCYPYDKCELVYSDKYISFYSTLTYTDGEDSEFAYVVSNMSEHANLQYNEEETTRFTYLSMLPNSYTPIRIGSLDYYDYPDKWETVVHFDIYDFINGTSFNGKYVDSTESFPYTVTKVKKSEEETQ